MVRRAMPFSELIGQDRALGALRSALARGALHHAYLFGGPEGVGKGTAARLLAQALNCEGAPAPEGRAPQEPTPHAAPPGIDPCGACGPCRKIARGIHPDVIELAEERVMAKAGRWEPKGGRAPSKDIVVDQVRDLVDHRLAMKLFEGRCRVVVVDPADAMNPQAQNALLKTLEEPPADTVLVLVASSPDVLLPTIRSRCARVSFSPLADDALAGRLAAAGRSPEEIRLSVALAGGSLGRALELDAKALALREEAVAAAADLDPGDASTWIAFAREQGEDREAARETCQLLGVWLRDVLAFQAAGETAALALGDLAPRTRAAAAGLDPAETLRRIEHAGAAAAALRQNAAPALALERMLIGWFHGELGDEG
jgi:DNA polymerase-3 subunit delta'